MFKIILPITFFLCLSSLGLQAAWGEVLTEIVPQTGEPVSQWFVVKDDSGVRYVNASIARVNEAFKVKAYVSSLPETAMVGVVVLLKSGEMYSSRLRPYVKAELPKSSHHPLAILQEPAHEAEVIEPRRAPQLPVAVAPHISNENELEELNSRLAALEAKLKALQVAKKDQ